MTVRKLSIALDPEVAARAEASARRHGTSLSGWIDEALRARLRVEDGLAAVAEWEAENGAFTPAERAEARKKVQRTLRRAGAIASTPKARPRKAS